MRLGVLALVAGGVAGTVAGAPCEAEPAPKGDGEISVKTPQGAIQVFTHKPDSFSSGPILFVFHGMKRNASSYRDYAIPLAQNMQAMVAAPCFDQESFPSKNYAQGNILNEDGSFQPRKDWSFTLGSEVIRAVLAREGNPQRPHFLLGHSAGGQFVVRYAAVETSSARRIVAANPGTYAFPRTDWEWPYGFGKLPSSLRGEENLRRFLAVPLTVMLGQGDTQPTSEAGNFDASPEANREGANRLERGRNFFEAGRKLATKQGWKFGWEKVEIPGIGHEGELMINDVATQKALR
jgi:poly(3-hydroxybutyrate) depolymerase